jgi:hypothetical protein
MMLTVSTVFEHSVSNMLNKFHGQPDSYDKKYASNPRGRLHANLSVGPSIDLEERWGPVHMVLCARLMDRRERSL